MIIHTPVPPVLPEYIHAYTRYVCPLKLRHPCLIQGMRIPPPIAQLEHIAIANQAPEGLRGLVIDALEHDDDAMVRFLFDVAPQFEILQQLFDRVVIEE